jgi:hypothetical protein
MGKRIGREEARRRLKFVEQLMVREYTAGSILAALSNAGWPATRYAVRMMMRTVTRACDARAKAKKVEPLRRALNSVLGG